MVKVCSTTVMGCSVETGRVRQGGVISSRGGGCWKATASWVSEEDTDLEDEMCGVWLS